MTVDRSIRSADRFLSEVAPPNARDGGLVGRARVTAERHTVEVVFDLFNRRRSDVLQLPITQPLVAGTVLAVEGALAAALLHPRSSIRLDLSRVDRCDTAGAALVHAFVALVHDGGGHVEVRGARPAVAAALRQTSPTPPSATTPAITQVTR